MSDSALHDSSEVNEATPPLEVLVKKKAHFKGMLYYSEWHHHKMLLSTCMCWFLLDIACVQLCFLLFNYLVDWFAIDSMVSECRAPTDQI